MRGKKAKQLRKNVYGDQHHKTDYIGESSSTTIREGRVLNIDGTRKKNNKGQILSIVKKIKMLVPKWNEHKIMVGKLRREYKDDKKLYSKGVPIKYTY